MDFALSIKTYLESKTSHESEAWECIADMEVGVGWPHQGRSIVRLTHMLGINYNV